MHRALWVNLPSFRRKVCHTYFTALLSFQCRLQDLPRIARRVPDVGNQMTAIFYHITVGSHDGCSFRYSLHTRWVKGAIKAFRSRGRSVKRMIRQQQSQRHRPVALFCVYDGPGCQLIKIAITAHHKPYSVIWRSTAAVKAGSSSSPASL